MVFRGPLPLLAYLGGRRALDLPRLSLADASAEVLSALAGGEGDLAAVGEALALLAYLARRKAEWPEGVEEEPPVAPAPASAERQAALRLARRLAARERLLLLRPRWRPRPASVPAPTGPSELLEAWRRLKGRRRRLEPARRRPLPTLAAEILALVPADGWFDFEPTAFPVGERAGSVLAALVLAAEGRLVLRQERPLAPIRLRRRR